ncbi:hypothetical protein N7520_004029 [Penicillium odoratum]|uniref:uncharacterized protein n=1 Tax=Penicillium odoratum TaxID=1167516 RepID=UPI002548D55F|nr:uncharacterized protein N7520_004029 [Penicillium odoratum]KAJ5769470.1 hypothetical protein N7520_004029 [Penicillium odoratum]
MQNYKSTVSLRKERPRALARWIHLLGQAALLQASRCPVLLSATSITIPTEGAPVNPIQDFKIYVSKASTETLSEELSKLLTKPLQRSDIKYQGSIYIFWQTPNFGHLKIGRSGNIHRRLNEWNKQCKKEMRIHFPDFAGNQNKSLPDMQQVPHISRVEALVHLELKRHRKIEERCPGCYKSHMEWFEVSKETAVKVVRKWTSWMATLPYEKHMKDGEEQWLLKTEEFKNLHKLCQPTEEFRTPYRPLKERTSLSRPRHSLPDTGREERARFLGF